MSVPFSLTVPLVRRDHPEDGLRRGGLAAARLADQGQHLAAGEREAHPVHRVHPEPGLRG